MSTQVLDLARIWQKAFGLVKRPVSQRDAARPAIDEGAAVRYVITLRQGLAVFRFLTFAMGAALVFFLRLHDTPPVKIAVLLSIVGLYNLFRILWRWNPSDYQKLNSLLVIGSDVFLSVTLVLMTNGLDSPFLVYSLAPILSAGLRTNARISIFAALVTSLSITGAYVFSSAGIGEYPPMLEENYLAISLLYVTVCIVIAYLPFLANLNLQARVKAESAAEERRRLRREVHDNIAQTLAFLSLKVKRAEERASSDKSPISTQDIVEIRGVVEKAYLAVRDYLDESAEKENDESFAVSLAKAADQWSRETGLTIEADLTDSNYCLMPRAKLHLLQIAREALSNIAKHAYPTRIRLSLERDQRQLILRIADDGVGFSPSQPRGHGLGIMSERAILIGADLQINSALGKGTEVVVTYQLDEDRGTGHGHN